MKWNKNWTLWKFQPSRLSILRCLHLVFLSHTSAFVRPNTTVLLMSLNLLLHNNARLITLQIVLAIRLCKPFKVIGIIHNLMIENIFYKFHHWNPGLGKQLSKSLENDNQCWPKLSWIFNRFCYECKIELISNNL